MSQASGQQYRSGPIGYHLPQTLQVTPDDVSGVTSGRAGIPRYNDVVVCGGNGGEGSIAIGTLASSVAFSDCLSSSRGKSTSWAGEGEDSDSESDAPAVGVPVGPAATGGNFHNTCGAGGLFGNSG